MLKQTKTQLAIKGMLEVYNNKLAVSITLLGALCFLFILSAIYNIGQIAQISMYSIGMFKKILIILSVTLNLYTNNLGLASLITHVILALLFSINIVVTVFYFKRRRVALGNKSTFVAMTLAALGAGCAACGGVLISSILSTTSAMGVLALLPFVGSFFMYIAIALLLYSISSTLVKVSSPLTC
jgi:hypothetical protein